jgi:RNA polymerase sigma factor (sigma-70 family)
MPTAAPVALLYHFCRLRLPGVALPLSAFEAHLKRGYELFSRKEAHKGRAPGWAAYLENLYPVDWFLACACLEGKPAAWEALFAARTHRSDCLLVDALRQRAVRLFPRDPEKQEEAVAEFWGWLLAGERDGAAPVLARYDGERPLVPWLIRVFQNKHLSELRPRHGVQVLPDDELENADLDLPQHGDERWAEEFREAARAWLADLSDADLLLLGLRLRYRLSQREVAGLLGIHEGNVSRQITKLRDGCLSRIAEQMQQAGWTGDDLDSYILREMDSLLLDEPRLSANRLAALLAARGKPVPAALSPTAR